MSKAFKVLFLWFLLAAAALAQPLDIVILDLPERPSDPPAGNNRVKVYGKDVAGVTRVFARLSNGTVLDLGDLGSGNFGEASLAGLVNNQSLWSGASASRTLTFSLSGANDPALNLSDGFASWNLGENITGTLRVGGAVTLTNGPLTVLGTVYAPNGWTTNGFPVGTGVGSLVGLGVANTNTGDYSVVSGGKTNRNEIIGGVIGGGQNNRLLESGADPSSNSFSGILSGEWNWIFGGNTKHSVIGGGISNRIDGARYAGMFSAWDSSIKGGSNQFIGGGAKNTNNVSSSVIGGGYNNSTVLSLAPVGVQGANVIGGGGSNLVAATYSSILGGISCSISNDLTLIEGSVIGGGLLNRIEGGYSVIGGGSGNYVGTGGTIVGGDHNACLGANVSFIGAGQYCTNGALWAAIGGGFNNLITDTGDNSSIPGGHDNVVSAVNAHIIGNNILNAVDGTVDIGDDNATKFTVGPTSVVVRSAMHISEITAPSTPAANQLKLYAKDSGGVSRLFYKGDNGTEYGPLDSGGGLSDGDKGDLTVSGGGATWTIDNAAVSYAKIQNVATARLLGRATAGSGVMEEIQLGTGLSFAGTTLNAAAGGEVTSSGSSVDNNLPRASGTSGDALDWTLVNINDTNGMSIPGGVAAHEILSTNGMTVNGLATFNGGLNYPPFALVTDFVDGRTNTQSRTITANTTLHLTNFVVGSYVVLDIVQDGTGQRTLTIDSTNTLVWRNSSNQTTAVSINTNANFRSQYTLFKPSASTIVIGGPDTAPTRFDVEWSSGSVPSADVTARISDETGSGGIVASNGPSINNLTLTGTTLDATGSGITLKMKGYIVLTHPHIFDGIGAQMVTNTTSITNGQAIFANGADLSTNAVKYVLTVPEDFDSSVDLRAKFKFRLGGADTGTHRYVISMISVADSAAYGGTPGNAVNMDYAGDASGADGDVETVGFTTLTNWRSNMTAGQHWVISLARDGDASQDASSVNSTSGTLVLEYGVSQ